MSVQTSFSVAEEKKLGSLIEKVLLQAKEEGATSAEARITVESGLSVTVRLGEVETLEFHRDKALGLTVYQNGQKGAVSTTDLSESGIQSAVSAACRIAKYAEEDKYAGLADPTAMATKVLDLDLYHPWQITPIEAIALATECENTARLYDKEIVNSEGATFTSHTTFRVYGNSHGFLGSYPSSYHSLSCSVIAERDGAMQRDDDYTVARVKQDLWTPSTVGKNAATRTLKRLGAKKIKTCQVPVLFSPQVAKSLWGNFLSAISGHNLYRQSSFLLDHIDQKVFPSFLSIEDKPHLLKGLGSTPFDGEGMATIDRSLVEKGILKSYVLNSYAVRKLGMKPFTHSQGAHNVVIPHTHTLSDLLRMMGKGILVTELIGQGVNIVTGDYSKGAAGFWVENGEIQYPVDEITIAGNLKEMFSHILGVGDDLDNRSAILSGSVLIEQMTIAGN